MNESQDRCGLGWRWIEREKSLQVLLELEDAGEDERGNPCPVGVSFKLGMNGKSLTDDECARAVVRMVNAGVPGFEEHQAVLLTWEQFVASGYNE